MTKIILWLTLIATSVLLFFSLTDSSTSIMWLASSTGNFILIRSVVIISIISLLVTKPPRNMLFRYALGAVSVSIAAWVMTATYQNHLDFLDTMTLLPFSIACGLSVLELNDNKLSQVPAMGIRRWTASIYAAYTLHGGKL